MVAFFLVTVFRNDDDKNETDNDEDDRGELNQWKRSKQANKKEPLHINSTYAKQGVSTLTPDELEQLKIKQSKRIKSKKLTREIVVNLIFVVVLFCTCYSNKENNAFAYNSHLKTTYKEYNDVTVFFFNIYFLIER